MIKNIQRSDVHFLQNVKISEGNLACISSEGIVFKPWLALGLIQLLLYSEQR